LDEAVLGPCWRHGFVGGVVDEEALDWVSPGGVENERVREKKKKESVPRDRNESNMIM